MFRAHRPILRRVHTAVHTTIGSVSVLLWPCALYLNCEAPPAHFIFTVFFTALRPNAFHGLLIYEVSRLHKTTHHSR